MGKNHSVTINGQLKIWDECSKAGSSCLVAEAPVCLTAYRSVQKGGYRMIRQCWNFRLCRKQGVSAG